MIPDDIAELKAELKDMSKAIAGMDRTLVAIQTNAAHSESSCPYQVRIARNENGVQIARSDAQQALALAQNNRVKIAQLVTSAAMGGSLGGGLVIIAQALLQLSK